MSKQRPIPSAYTRGWVLCSPAGILQPGTLRQSSADAIAAKYRVRKTRERVWADAQAKGWTVRFIYVRFFVPVFKSTNPTTEMSEVHDVEDV